MDEHKELVEKLKELVSVWKNSEESFFSTTDTVRKKMIDDVEKLIPVTFEIGEKVSCIQLGDVYMLSIKPTDDGEVKVAGPNDDEEDGTGIYWVPVNTIKTKKEKK